MRRLQLAALSLSLLAAGVPAAEAATPAVYPTDRCVSDKLAATARACRAVFEKLAFEAIPLPGPPGLDGSRATLQSAWNLAEAASEAAGVDCSQTTATADAVFDHLVAGAAEIAAQVAAGAGPHVKVFSGTRAAGIGCSQLLNAESLHLLRRNKDRARTTLDRDQGKAKSGLDALLRSAGFSTADRAALATSVEALSEELALANLVSPNVSQQFTMIEPPATVEYQGEELAPICSSGTPWVYFVRRGTVNKLLVYYQGGGACWDYLTCGAIKTFKQTAGAGDNPANATRGFANLQNPENPFRDWHVVFVPYCTGDVHWGDRTVEHVFTPVGGEPDPSLGKVTIQHRGFVNAQVAEKFAREHFVNPDEVFVTGSSAGSYGAILNGLYLMEKVYPSSPFAVLGDAGNGVVPQAFLENEISKWGIEENLPDFIPALNVPVTELDAADLWAESAKAYPRNRFANYTTAYDGGSGGQVGFYTVMTNPGNPILWSSWWSGTCPWHEGMQAQVAGAFAGSPQNYRYYIGSGSRHTMWGLDKVYTDTTGNVPTIVSWIQAMRAGSQDWVNVMTEDPGLLLSGDPRPNPAQTPYTAAGRIVCEAPATE